MSDLPGGLKSNPALERWVGVDPDGTLVIRSGKVELGQGIQTAMALIAASEFRVPVERIRVSETGTDLAPNEGFTAGSFSVEAGGAAMRVACAMARELFAAAAARELGGAADDITVEDGLFRLASGNAALGYGDLVDKVDLARQVTDLPAPRLLGLDAPASDAPRADLEAKLSGAAYIQDIRLPGMLFGRVLRADAPHRRLAGFDRDRVSAMPGVVAVVQDGAFAGVVATRDDLAEAAVEAARKSATWAEGPAPAAEAETQSWLDPALKEATVVLDEGEAAGGQRLSAEYARPYLLHASIGPSCAVAEWKDGHLTVHSHCQGVYPLRGQLAKVFDMAPEAVTVIHAHGAGCYGHNGADDVALDAALLARGLDRPVMVTWGRADEMSWSPHGAAMRVALEAGLEQGRITDWTCRVISLPHVARPGAGGGVNLLAAWDLEKPFEPGKGGVSAGADNGGDRNAIPLYNVGARRVLHHELPQGPLRSSAMRSLGAHANIFAAEGFMDELAAAAGADPVAFRLAHCEDARAAAVIRAAADAAGWDPDEKGGAGEGRGFGVARYKGSGAYYAAVARVRVDGDVRVLSVNGAVDAGHVIHRDGILNQIEGGVVQAASWTLKEAAHWTAEGFATRSWDDYPIIGFQDIPAIETVIVHSGAPATGAGECAAGPVAAAIGNAVAHALGLRIRRMPITREAIIAAIEAA